MHTGSTKVSSVARWPAAMISLSTPENNNVDGHPMTNVSRIASHGIGAASVPRLISHRAVKPNPP